MASMYQQIMALAEETAREITSDTERYMAFLTTAAHNFKYSFRDQLLIFAQRPDATACAEISFWNSRGRWVNRLGGCDKRHRGDGSAGDRRHRFQPA